MKNLLYIIPAFFLLMVSCTDDFEDYNLDRKNPSVVSGESLFSNAQVAMLDQISSTNVNLNVFKLFAQHWTETTYNEETNYDVVNRSIPDFTFREYYRGILRDFQEADLIIRRTPLGPIEVPQEKTNKLFIIDLLVVYSYQNLVDIFGDIPYQRALDIDSISPQYDDDAFIYQDLIRRIDVALDSLDPNFESFGAADLVYGGDVAQWRKFANTLKLKLGITMADANPVLARATVESAVAGGIFESSADDALLQYLTAIHVNPLYEDLVQSGRDDFVPANTLVNLMNSLNDPRRPLYFTQIGGEYRGGIYGSLNNYSQYSHIAEPITQPDFPGILLTYYETLFYLAEAAARGYTVGGPAQQFYNTAVTESILWWGGTPAAATAYLAQPSVAWTSPGSGVSWQEKIARQEYIAFYTRGLEAWTTWRRLDYPVLNVPELVDGYGDIPKRFPYPVNEQTLNAANYRAASEAIGGDLMTNRIFWDVRDPVAPAR
jgi:hypothetical protein